MSNRQLRRAAERNARAAANQANARLSTGPTSAEGKAISSQNNFRHGLAGTFKVLASESQHEFDHLLADLRDEHQPATRTEDLLVSKMAEHHWLARRAQTLQDRALADEAQPLAVRERSFALYLRYQTTNDRAFLKCLNELGKLRAGLRKEQLGFESQKRQQEDREIEAEVAKLMSAPIPGFPYEEYERLRQARRDVASVINSSFFSFFSQPAPKVWPHPRDAGVHACRGSRDPHQSPRY